MPPKRNSRRNEEDEEGKDSIQKKAQQQQLKETGGKERGRHGKKESEGGRGRRDGGVAAVNAPFGIQPSGGGDPKGPYLTVDELMTCENATDEKLMEFALKRFHSSKTWRESFQGGRIERGGRESSSPPSASPGLKRALRRLVQMQTINALLKGKYWIDEDGNGDGDEAGDKKVGEKKTTSVLLNKKRMFMAVMNSRVYQNDHLYAHGSTKKSTSSSSSSPSSEQADTSSSSSSSSSPSVLVFEGDCISVALHLRSTLSCTFPLVLNMASSNQPGGGYRKGAGAQEENLHRRTNLFQCLEDPYRSRSLEVDLYPIPEFGGIYTPNAAVIRGSEDKGYPFLKDPEWLSFVSVYAYKDPPTEDLPPSSSSVSYPTERILTRRIAQRTKRKLKAIFSIALENNHDAVVLSAIGCGAYSNPPRHIAQLFREVIQELEQENWNLEDEKKSKAKEKKERRAEQVNQGKKEESLESQTIELEEKGNKRKGKRNKLKVIAFAIIEDHNSGKDHNPNGNLIPFAETFRVEPITMQELK